ncbi:MAG TPA: DMT family transporter [Actinophytocola sp.]|jgi:drug/metabolite transporter (DMT)-like permease|nr:DMT family transporter [Actinophytocola sp.]
MTALAIVFAVLGALCSAVGAQLQHQGVRSETKDSHLGLRSIGRLVHNRRWLLGVAVLTACAMLQILALALAPVTIVAPIVVLALPAVAVLNARWSGERLDTAATVAVMASTLGVALFVALASGRATSVEFPPSAVLLACQIIAGAVVLFGVIGVLREGIVRCVMLATGAGAAYGLVSVLVRDVTYTFQTEGFRSVAPLSATALVVAFAIGSWYIQLAYASGPPDIVVGCQTVLSPLVATAIAIGLLDETANAGGIVGLGMVAAALVAVFGVLMLARHHPEATSRATPHSAERRLFRAGSRR